MIRLFGIYLVNKTIKYDEWRWICLRTVDFYIIDAWRSFFRGKNENIQKVYSIGLWICLPWDFPASSWDHEIVLKTVRLKRSALEWGEGCLMLWQFYAWHCIVINSVQKYKNKEQKVCRSVGQVWGGGEGGLYVHSLNFKYGHFPFWGVGHVPLPGWYLPMLQFHLALCCFFKAMLLKNV